MRGSRLLVVTLAFLCALSGRAVAEADGAAAYARCSGCHKATGMGVPDIFPPLAGHAAKLAKASRVYLVEVVVFGLTGEIRVDGRLYKGRMPAYAGLLGDEGIAAVLNYVLSSWGNDKVVGAGFAKITPDEVKAVRAGDRTPDQVYLAREKLSL